MDEALQSLLEAGGAEQSREAIRTAMIFLMEAAVSIRAEADKYKDPTEFDYRAGMRQGAAMIDQITKKMILDLRQLG